MSLDAEKYLSLTEEDINMVYKVAFVRVENEEDAKDITGQVFLKIINARVVFKDAGHKKAYLIRSAINQTRNFKSTVWQKKTGGLSEDIAAQPKETDAILDEVKKLDRKLSIIIHLFYYERYKINEIAKLLGVNENTVKTRLSAAKKKLKKLLREEDFDV